MRPGGAAGKGGVPPLAAGALLFASGASALVFETLWVKQLGRVVGVEVHAVTVALGAFFAGLALGSAVFGRMADRTTRPLRLYVVLEVGVAGIAFASTLLLARSAGAFVALEDTVAPLAWALPYLLVGVPACLMGGTLPALVRALGPADGNIGRATGVLYAANTAGAIAGTVAAPFFLVPAAGIRGAGLAAGGLSLIAGLAALALDRAVSRPPEPAPPRALPSHDARLALWLYALAGGVALGYEVIWSEMLVPFLSTRAYAFATMLATYLAGLSLGSFFFAGAADRMRRPWLAFGWLIAGAGAAAILTVGLLGAWLPDAQTFAGMWTMRITGSETAEVMARFALAAAVMLLPTTLLLGAAFPMAARLAAGAARVGRDVGRVAALNTAGGIAGTLVTGFVLVPRLGLVRSLGALAGAGALIGAVAIARGLRGRPAVRLVPAAVVIVVLVAAMIVPSDKLGRLLAAERGGTLVFYAEDSGGTTAVLEQQGVGSRFRRLYIQGVSNSGDSLTSLRYMRLQALLPLLIHAGEPRSILVVGLGTGITAGASLAYPGLDRRVVVELLPGVVSAAPLFQGNFGAAADPRVDIRIGDGRHDLMRHDETYDVITLEPPPPSAAGVVNLYSRDFYELCRARLAPGGLMAQWWPLPTQNDEDSRSLVQSFLDVFPYVTAWTTELHEVLLVGSEQPIVLDGPTIAARFSRPATLAALAEVGIRSPAALLATWLAGRSALEAYAGDAPPVTDNRPLIEHAAWVRRGEIERVLPRLLDLASEPPIEGDDALLDATRAERHRLFSFYRAALHAYAGEREAAAAMLGEAMRGDPDNPYYRWVALGGESR